MSLAEITYKTIKLVQFPIFALRSDNIAVFDNVITIDGKIVDNGNLQGDSLGKRRLQLIKSRKYKLTKTIPDFAALIKSKHLNFIDNAGKPFTYVKTKYVDVRSYKVLKVSTVDTYSILRLTFLTG